MSAAIWTGRTIPSGVLDGDEPLMSTYEGGSYWSSWSSTFQVAIECSQALAGTRELPTGPSSRSSLVTRVIGAYSSHEGNYIIATERISYLPSS